MAYISKRNRRREREIRNAARNRREIIAARLSRRDLIKDLKDALQVARRLGCV